MTFDIPGPKNRNEGGYIRQNRPFAKPPFYFLSICVSLLINDVHSCQSFHRAQNPACCKERKLTQLIIEKGLHEASMLR